MVDAPSVSRPTVSLQMIVKDEYEQVAAIIENSYEFFDELNITVSDKPTANKLKKIGLNKLNVKWREWNNRFDDARNANYAMSTTDYTFWLDADDEFDFQAIPQLVEIAHKNDIDAIFLPYNYAQDEFGNCITRHWRERLVRNGKGFEWRGWVHETYISDQPYVSHKVNCEVLHQAPKGHVKESIVRNHKILEEAFEATEDPRYLHYLGISQYTNKDYETAIETLTDYLQVGGSVEDAYRSLCIISEAAYHLGKHDSALEYAAKCTIMKPEYPMGYWLLAQYEADQENWKESLEWIKVSESKPDPDTLSVYDPTARERAALMGAQAEFMLGNFNSALAYLRKIPNNPSAQDLLETFTQEADAETFIKLLPKIRKFFSNDTVLYNSLCYDLRYDNRIKGLRHIASEPKVWDEKSIVLFCGQGYEEWGPHTLNKGMGGSEEAVVYLAPELARLGYMVTVYGEVPEQIVELPKATHDATGAEYNPPQQKGSVTWKPWKEIDMRDEFNIFIAWRAPQYLEKVNAKVKIADIHDVLPESMMKDYPDVTYFVKTNYHRNLYPKLADDKFKVIGNGIKKEQFDAS